MKEPKIISINEAIAIQKARIKMVMSASNGETFPEWAADSVLDFFGQLYVLKNAGITELPEMFYPCLDENDATPEGLR